MPKEPWETLGYIPNLVKNLKKDFGITPYQYKSSTAPGSNKLFQNFQWVKTDDVRIARCAQPGYKSQDEEHGFSIQQCHFLRVNGIKTIISLNSKCHKTESKDMLLIAGIEHYHISIVDFNALLVSHHEQINNIISSRKPMGGFLFYCGYGQGRTGTAIAGWMARYIKMKVPNYFVNMSPDNLHKFFMLACGVEKKPQSYFIGEYMRKMATIAPAPGSMRPRLLSEVNYARFEDNPQSTMKTPPPLPGGKPVFSQGTKPNVINIQSINPTGNLTNTARGGAATTNMPLKISSNNWNENNRFTPPPAHAKIINLNSFYFNRLKKT